MTTNIPNGFRLVPGVSAYAVNEEGIVYSLRMRKLATISTQKSGYKTVAYAESVGKTKTFYVHRLVALTWIPVPEALQGLENLEVNHDDGDKSNNKRSNLEWCTSKQNIKHAIDNGLTPLVKVKAKHLITGEELVFSNATDMARHFSIVPRKLTNHLVSELAGMITKDYWVFMDANRAWPEISPDQIIENRWAEPRGLWIASKDGKRWVGSTLQIVCQGIGVKYHSVQPEVRSDGKTYGACGFSFHYSNLPTKEMMDLAVYSESKPQFREQRSIRVTTSRPYNVNVFGSLRQAARAVGIADTTLLYVLTKKEGRHLGMLFEYVDSNEQVAPMVKAAPKEYRAIKAEFTHPWVHSKVFTSIKKASRATGVKVVDIVRAIKQDDGHFADKVFSYV